MGVGARYLLYIFLKGVFVYMYVYVPLPPLRGQHTVLCHPRWLPASGLTEFAVCWGGAGFEPRTTDLQSGGYKDYWFAVRCQISTVLSNFFVPRQNRLLSDGIPSGVDNSFLTSLHFVFLHQLQSQKRGEMWEGVIYESRWDEEYVSTCLFMYRWECHAPKERQWIKNVEDSIADTPAGYIYCWQLSRWACMFCCSSSCLLGVVSWACQTMMSRFTSRRKSTFFVVLSWRGR